MLDVTVTVSEKLLHFMLFSKENARYPNRDARVSDVPESLYLCVSAQSMDRCIYEASMNRQGSSTVEEHKGPHH